LYSLQPKPLSVAPGTTHTQVQLQVLLTDREHPLAGAPCANGCLPGVYSVDIQVRDAAGRTQARLVTFLLLAPPAPTAQTPLAPLHVALVVPIASDPTLRADGHRVLPASARQRLTRTLTGLTVGPGLLLPITLAPSPELVQTLAASDAALHDRLGTAAGGSGRDLLAPPFVPFDQPSWARQPALNLLTGEQVTTGRSIITALDPNHPPDTTTWIASGDIDNGALGPLDFLGFKRLLVPSQALPDTSDTAEQQRPNDYGSTLTRPFRLSGDPTGQLQAVDADSTMRDEAGASDSLLGIQTLLADLTIVWETDVSQGSNNLDRGVAVVLPDRWDPSTAALTQLITALTSHPIVSAALLQPVTLDKLFASASGTASTGSNTSGGNSSGSTSQQLITRQLIGNPSSAASFAARVAHTSQLMNAYRATFTGGVGLARSADLDARVRTAGFAGFNDATRTRYLTAVDTAIAADLGRIVVPPTQTVTLTSRSGNIPFTIRNGTGAPIQLMVAVESNERVTFPTTTQFVTVPGEGLRIDFRVHTRTSGDTPVQVKLWTPDGSTEIAASRITVRSTAVSGVGLVLTIGAGAFLIVWWLSHWRRSRKRRANAGTANPPTPPRAPATPTAVGTHRS
jgi:hypothetical protein